MKNFTIILILMLFSVNIFAQNFRAETKYDLGEMPRYSKTESTRSNQIIASWGFWKQGSYNYLEQALADGWFYAGGDSEGQTFQAKNIYCLTATGCNGGELIIASSWSYYFYEIFHGTPPQGNAEDLNNWFISPKIEIPNDGELYIVEWGDWSPTNINGDKYKMMISPTGDSLISSFTHEFADVTVENGGTSYAGLLNEFAGQTIRIAFWHYGGQDATQSGAVFCNYLEVYKYTPWFPPTFPIYFASGRVGESMVKHTNILAPQSTGDITATSSNPALYLVSSDGIDFAETANFGSTGGTLYVQFTPQEIGKFEGDTIIVYHNSTTKKIELYGEATDCRYIETPYYETFLTNDTDLSQNSHWCWDLLKEDAANTNSAPYIPYSTDEGTYISFNSNKMQQPGISYNQWAITPELHTAVISEELPLDHFTVSFEHRAYYYPTYNKPEKFAVGHSSTDNNFASFTFGQTQDAISRDYVEYATELPAGTKYVAIKCMTNLGYGFDVRNVNITPIYEPSSVTGLIKKQLLVYPNPAKNELQIMNYELRDGEMITISDLQGRVVSSYELKITNYGEATINVSDLPNGTYIVKVGNKTAKIVKE